MLLKQYLALLGVGVALSLHAATTSFTYQGLLSQGTNAASGLFDFRFTLYTTPVDGFAITSPVTNAAVNVDNGLFTTMVDFGSGVWTGEDGWLEIAVRTNAAATFTTLSNRQAVTPVPYALYAPASATAATANSVAATNITGTIPMAQLPAALLTNGASGVNLSGVFKGDGAGLTKLYATNLVPGYTYGISLPYFHDYSPPGVSGQNVFIAGAGNFTMTNGGPIYTSSRNVGIGPNVLNSLTTGYFNYGIGWQALNALTTGSGNVALGGHTDPYDTTGFDNVAIADDALWSNLCSSVNVAVGHRAGANLLASGAPSSTTGANVFLGYRADVVAGPIQSNLVYSTALGAGAVVTASYQTVIGGSMVTQAVINGSAIINGTSNIIKGATIINGPIIAASPGSNIRLTQDGTAQNDAFLGVGSNTNNVIQLANWSGTRGIIVPPTGGLTVIGTAPVTVRGGLRCGATISATNSIQIFSPTGGIFKLTVDDAGNLSTARVY